MCNLHKSVFYRNLTTLQRFMGSLTKAGLMDSDDNIGGFKLAWADLPTSLSFSGAITGIPSWNVFGDDIVESCFVLAAEFLHRDGSMVCTLRTEHLGITV